LIHGAGRLEVREAPKGQNGFEVIFRSQARVLVLALAFAEEESVGADAEGMEREVQVGTPDDSAGWEQCADMVGGIEAGDAGKLDENTVGHRHPRRLVLPEKKTGVRKIRDAWEDIKLMENLLYRMG